MEPGSVKSITQAQLSAFIGNSDEIRDPISDDDFTEEDVQRMSALAETKLKPFGVMGLELLLLGDDGLIYLRDGESLQKLGGLEEAAGVLTAGHAPLKCWFTEDEECQDEESEHEETSPLNTDELRKQIDAEWEKMKNDPKASPQFLQFCQLLESTVPRQEKNK